MLDSVLLVFPIHESKIDLKDWEYIELKGNPTYKYFHLFFDDETGICLKYYGYGGAFNPSRIRIEIPSLPKLIRGENVRYFTAADLPAFSSVLTWVFSRAGIVARVDPRDLYIEDCDLAVNIGFNTKREKSLVQYALTNQFPLSATHPVLKYDDGVYARHANYGDTADYLTGNTGLCTYDKTDDAEDARFYSHSGVLRMEIRLKNRQAMIRRFGRDDPGRFGTRYGRRPSLLEIMNDRDATGRLFDYHLRNLGIRPGITLVSIDTAEYFLTKKLNLRLRYEDKSRWPTILLKLQSIYDLGQYECNWGPSKASVKDMKQFQERVIMEETGMNKRQLKYFRDQVLGKKVGVMSAFLQPGNEDIFDLHHMIKTEMDDYWNGSSKFIHA